MINSSLRKYNLTPKMSLRYSRFGSVSAVLKIIAYDRLIVLLCSIGAPSPVRAKPTPYQWPHGLVPARDPGVGEHLIYSFTI